MASLGACCEGFEVLVTSPESRHDGRRGRIVRVYGGGYAVDLFGDDAAPLFFLDHEVRRA